MKRFLFVLLSTFFIGCFCNAVAETETDFHDNHKHHHKHYPEHHKHHGDHSGHRHHGDHKHDQGHDRHSHNHKDHRDHRDHGGHSKHKHHDSYKYSFSTHLNQVTSIKLNGTSDDSHADLLICEKTLNGLAAGSGLPVKVAYSLDGSAHIISGKLNFSAILHPTGGERLNAFLGGGEDFKTRHGDKLFGAGKYGDYKLSMLWFYAPTQKNPHNKVSFVFTSKNHQCVLSSK